MAIVALTAMSLAAAAQNDLGKTDDIGRIALSPVIFEDSPIPEGSANIVLSKLTQAVTANGLAADSFDPRFVITANLVELSHETTATTPVMQALVLTPTLYIGDAATGTLYATCVLDNVKGAGTNVTKAYNQAVKAMRTDTPAVRSFIDKAKKRIVEYYNSQIDFIISEARALAAQEKYNEAIGLLFTVPTVCKAAYDKAMATVGNIYQQMIDIEGERMLNAARNIWNAGQSWESAMEAASCLSAIHPLASCVPAAIQLSNTIGERVRQLDEREWNFAMKQFDASVSLESQRIAAAKEVGIAMAQHPATYYNMNHFGWW